MPRITGKDAEGLMAAYAKVHAPKEEEVAVETPVAETPAEDIQEDNLKEFQTRGTSPSAIARQERINALRKDVKPFMNQGKVTVSSNNSSGTPQRVQTTTTNVNSKSSGINRGGGSLQQAAANIDAMRSPAIGSRQVKPGLIGNLLGNRGGSTPQAKPAPQAQAPAQQAQARPVAQAQRTVGGQGNRQTAVKTGGIQLGKSIRGGLGALGNLAGRAVGGIKQGAQAVAGGAQAVAGKVAKGAQAVAGALQNKGPIQGRSGANAAMKAKGLPGATGGSGGTAPLAKPVAQAPVAKPVQAAPQAKPAAPAQAPDRSSKEARMARRDARMQKIKARGNPGLQAKLRMKQGTPVNQLFNSYDLIDDTVNFLISEGYVANESDALSIMSEPEFMESFNTGLSEVLNESSENNK